MSEPELEVTGLPWVQDDGGRAGSGFRGEEVGDCAVRAIAIALGIAYREVYDGLRLLQVAAYDGARTKSRKDAIGRSPRDGVPREVMDAYLSEHDWVWVPVVRVGMAERMHMRVQELPEEAMIGPVILRISKHVCAVVGGVVRDTHDPSREGGRMIYGYYAPRMSVEWADAGHTVQRER